MLFLSELFGHHESLADADSPVSLVTCTANLASRPSEIDPILDKMRVITSQLQPGQSLNTRDEQTVFQVYLQIEKYLTTKDPVRKFTKEELRGNLQPSLRQKLINYEAKGAVNV